MEEDEVNFDELSQSSSSDEDCFDYNDSDSEYESEIDDAKFDESFLADCNRERYPATNGA